MQQPSKLYNPSSTLGGDVSFKLLFAMITLECTADYRTFKKGEVFEFKEPTIIVGPNRSGKTTLLSAIRGYFSKGVQGDFWDQQSPKYEEALEFFQVTSTIQEALAFFSREDSGEAQTYDAVSLIQGGGYNSNRMSRGEAAAFGLNKTFKSLENIKGKLILLDEADLGYDLKAQVNFTKLLLPKLIIDYQAFPLVVTHNYLSLINSNLPIYSMEARGVISIENLVKSYEADEDEVE